jgi:Tol biopolymer transport system component
VFSLQPIWSPDSRFVAFSSNRAGTFDLYQKLASGGREELLDKTSNTGVLPTSWSEDGRFLVYTRAGVKTGFDVWVLPLFGERKAFPFLETIHNEAQGQLSSSGHWIAYTSDETGTLEIYVQPFPATGAKWQVSTGGGFDPHWHRDGRELFFIAPDRKLMVAAVETTGSTFQFTAPQALFDTHMPTTCRGALFSNYWPAADGQRFLVNTIASEPRSTPITVVLHQVLARTSASHR